mgnify:CR=1 FL=1
MSIQAWSTDNHETEYQRFLSTLKQAALMLDTLAQFQAAVGDLSMSSKSGTTFEVQARLENYIKQIEYNYKREVK